jgi:5,6-dimethylbenzimidazole synthase
MPRSAARWTLAAYLCLGDPVEEHLDPELERQGRQSREVVCRQVLRR